MIKTRNIIVTPASTPNTMSDAQLFMNHAMADFHSMAKFTVYTISQLFNVTHTNPETFISYLQKLYHVTEIPLTVVIYALKYLDRLYLRYPHLNSADNHQKSIVITGMFTTAIILANHFIEDHAYTNKTWAEVTGIHQSMVNTTQRQFMALLDFRLSITSDEYQQWTNQLFLIYSSAHYQQQQQQQQQKMYEVGQINSHHQMLDISASASIGYPSHYLQQVSITIPTPPAPL